MKKSFICMLAALVGVTMVSCSSDDDGPSAGPTVGITAVQVTPSGSAKSYTCVIKQDAMTIENTNDSVDWDVIDASLSKTKVIATATLGAKVYYNDVEVEIGRAHV